MSSENGKEERQDEMAKVHQQLPAFVPRSQLMQLLGVKKSKLAMILRDFKIKSHRSPFTPETVIKREDVERLLEMKAQNFVPEPKSQDESQEDQGE